MTYRNNWRFPTGLVLDPERPRKVPIQRPVRDATEVNSRSSTAAAAQGAAEHRVDPKSDPAAPDVAVRDRRWWAQSPEAGEPAREAGEPGKPTHVATLEAEIERLNHLVAEKDRKMREAEVRAQVATREATLEIERAKERIRKDAGKEIEQHRRAMLLVFVEVLDNLDRALDAARQSQQAPAVVQGVELVRKEFLTRLAQFDVSPFASLDQPFDPSCHEALSTMPVSEAEKDGLVLGVVREGYRIGDDILRPAAVAVGKHSH